MRWKDTLGPTRDWLVVGLLLALVIIPAFVLFGLVALIVISIAWAANITLSAAVLITAGVLFLFRLVRRMVRGRR